MPRYWLAGSCFWSSTYFQHISDVLAYQVSLPTTRPRQINAELISQGTAYRVQIIIAAPLGSGTGKLFRCRVRAKLCARGVTKHYEKKAGLVAFCLFFPTRWQLAAMNLMHFLHEDSHTVLDKSSFECPVICKELMSCYHLCPWKSAFSSFTLCNHLQIIWVYQRRTSVRNPLCLRRGSISALVKDSKYWAKVIWRLLLSLSNCGAGK